MSVRDPDGYEVVEVGPDTRERLSAAVGATETGVVVVGDRSGLSDLSRLAAFVGALQAGAAAGKPTTSTDGPD